ncbi:MAG: biosynthetic arginine decarboxylase [Parachlamydiales bacterium]|jgi:arginine decarboxylase
MTDDKTYWIDRWGQSYFKINEDGHIAVIPDRQGNGGDLYSLISSLVEQGIEAPILIRFNGIIRDRIESLTQAFRSAIKDFQYRNEHRIAYPIKVNPQRHVVEVVQQSGQKYSMGLEVGSKPELIAILALETSEDALLLCNGYKDAEYISLALMASKLGRQAIIIIEQTYELKLVLKIAENLGVEAELGFRMKLSNKGTGKWKSSGGEHSKFGLFSYEIMDCLEILKAHGKAGWLKLLHFHIGSQITSIESIKKALNEGVRMYTELASKYPTLHILDVGGGLAVDYDGTKSIADSSMNYTLEEYARDVIYTVGQACLTAGIADPLIITESGRAIVSHHSVMIIEVIDVTSTPKSIESGPPPSEHEIILNLSEMEKELSLSNCREVFHDIMELRERILEEFVHEKLSLEERAYAERSYRVLLLKIRSLFQQQNDIPEEMEELNQILLENYFCNFSVFQSLPDAWAIGQLFPVMPIHRLKETPSHRAVIADLSCDSDGKISSFIGKREPEDCINLHPYQEEPYYLGIFLVGAYQEILGGLHNLFGDTNVVHAELGPDGRWEISRLVEGDSIEEVLHYVQYNPEKLKNQLNLMIEKSLKAGRLSNAESAQVKKEFKQALESYTYLVV